MRNTNRTSKLGKTSSTGRDHNIRLHTTGEICLSTRSVPDKTKYSRKTKHRSKGYDY